MEYAIGFLIAFVMAITGVGAGSITAPLLLLFLHVPVEVGVGTALAYSTLVKLIVVPIQVWRRQINYRILLFHAHRRLARSNPWIRSLPLLLLKNSQNLLYIVLGLIIAGTSAWHILRYFKPKTRDAQQVDRPRSLAAAMLPVGIEVGFSSSGAGALGTIALLGFTSLTTAQIVGTDLAFGFFVSLAGSGIHMLHGGYDSALLTKLVCGGTLGALAGSAAAPRLPNRQLRLALSAWLLILGLQFCYRAVADQVKATPIPTVQSSPSTLPVTASIVPR